MPLTTAAARDRGQADETRQRLFTRERLSVPLLQRLGEGSLYVPGRPGSGKSTFCRWVALAVCDGELAPHPIEPLDEYREPFPESLRN